jgi:hypothetical protein
MNTVSLHDPSPKDVTFFIGPDTAPPGFQSIYQKAVVQKEAGNPEALNQLLELQTEALRELAEGTGSNSPLLKRLIENQIDSEIGNYSVFVSKGFMKRTWVPTLTINLDQLTGPDGSPIGHILSKHHGDFIAAMLGQTFKADWIYTSWTFPSTPIEIERKPKLSEIKEG